MIFWKSWRAERYERQTCEHNTQVLCAIVQSNRGNNLPKNTHSGEHYCLFIMLACSKTTLFCPNLGYVIKNFKSNCHSSFAAHFYLLKKKKTNKETLASASMCLPPILLLPVEANFKCSEFRRMECKFLVCFTHTPCTSSLYLDLIQWRPGWESELFITRSSVFNLFLLVLGIDKDIKEGRNLFLDLLLPFLFMATGIYQRFILLQS